MNGPEDKLEELKRKLRKWGRIAIGFSGGVDSTFLAKVARDALGDGVLAVTARSQVHSAREREDAVRAAAEVGVRQRLIDLDIWSVPHFGENPKDRCYHCKRAVFTAIRATARKEGFLVVADGTNADDSSDDRPGVAALRELGIESPLRDVGLTKEEIRAFSRRMGLSTAEKPAMACLATRIPHGEPLTTEKLQAVERVENALFGMGFRQARARHHGELVRIELGSGEMDRMLDAAVRRKTVEAAKSAGFCRVTLDLEGYRTSGIA